jgi:hypothetical protein
VFVRLSFLGFLVFAASCQCGASGPDGGTSGVGGNAGQQGGVGGQSGGGTGGGGVTDLDAGLNDFCAGNAPVPVTGGGTTLCSGDLGKRTFTFAFCSCTDIAASNGFRVGALAGARDGGGSVGVNGTFTGGNNSVVNGTLWCANDARSSNNLRVGRDLVSGANVTLSTGAIGRNMVVVGNAISGGSTTVGGEIRANANSVVTGFGNAPVVRGTQTVAPPCDCSSPVDVTGIVGFFRSVNDNAARGISSAAFTGSSNVDITLECGRYLFTNITPSGPLRIRTRGRVVIAVEGDVLTGNGFELVPEANSQVDVFIAGNLSLANSARLGDSARPAATRVYVGGTSVSAANNLDIGANLYAGRAAFSASNAVNMKGALFVGSLAAANSFTIDYDDAILSIDGCSSPDAGCSSCRQCANPTPACRNGGCARCQSDSDCCPPLSCETSTGRCVEGVVIQ